MNKVEFNGIQLLVDNLLHTHTHTHTVGTSEHQRATPLQLQSDGRCGCQFFFRCGAREGRPLADMSPFSVESGTAEIPELLYLRSSQIAESLVTVGHALLFR